MRRNKKCKDVECRPLYGLNRKAHYARPRKIAHIRWRNEH